MADQKNPSDSDSESPSIPSLEWNTMDTIKYQLSIVSSDVKALIKEIRTVSEQHTQYLVWKENTEGRLLDGLRTMNETKEQIVESRNQIRQCREDFMKQMSHSNEQFANAMKALTHNLNDKIDPLTHSIPEKIQDKLDLRYIRRDMVKWVVFGFMLSGAAGGALGKMVLDFITRH